MNLIEKAISSLELAIRYLLTGAVVAVLFVFRLSDYKGILSIAESNEVTTTLVVVLVGMATFSIYRIFFWTAGDFIAWKLKWSAPSLHESSNRCYDGPYTKFLWWRHEGCLTDRISDYLTYRWSVAHFASISGIALLLEILTAETGSHIANYACVVVVCGFLLLALGLWQCSFLWRVERNLQKDGYTTKTSS